MVAILSYAVFCILFAYLQAQRIKKKPIHHFWNGLLHISISTGIWLYYHDCHLFFANLFFTRITFDAALNGFRNLKFDYVSPSPKSIVDKTEKFIFKEDGLTPKFIYLALTIYFIL